MPGTILPTNPKLASVPDVEIGPAGTFKYILCKIFEGSNRDDHKHIVRGDVDAQFHSDIYDALDAVLETEGITCECVGGGKIHHDPETKSINVFGKSQGYGQANHSLTAQILKQTYKDYASIIWSDG
ncbi:hypothetical protein ScPMuIL_017132 [Solemya velum]